MARGFVSGEARRVARDDERFGGESRGCAGAAAERHGLIDQERRDGYCGERARGREHARIVLENALGSAGRIDRKRPRFAEKYDPQ